MQESEQVVEERKTDVVEPGQDLEGINGWLLLVGLGIIISPFYIIYSIYPIYTEIFKTGVWEILTTPGTEAYNSLWAVVLIGEIAVNLLMVGVWLYIAYLFFTKKKTFPKWYIGLLIFTIVFILLDAFAIKLVVPEESVFDQETLKQLGRSLLVSLIWVTYMRFSVRVKQTFVN